MPITVNTIFDQGPLGHIVNFFTPLLVFSALKIGAEVYVLNLLTLSDSRKQLNLSYPDTLTS